MAGAGESSRPGAESCPAATGVPGPLLRDKYVRHHLDTATTDDVVIIISTTTLLEAGRDLDSDWAVTEPSSVRSAIQLAGRVMRHRFREALAPNIGVLDIALKTLFGKMDEHKKLARPGVETPLRMEDGWNKAARVQITEGQRAASKLFDMQRWSGRLDAGPCLVGDDTVCGRAEAAMLEWGVLGSSQAAGAIGIGSGRIPAPANRYSAKARLLSVAALMERPDGRWDDGFARLRQFRRADPSLHDIEFRLDGDLWMLRDRDTVKSAKEARRTGDGQRDEWQPARTRSHVDFQPASPTRAAGRLLFPRGMYDVEYAAAAVESNLQQKDVVVGSGVARDLRALSIAPHFAQTEKDLYFHPWLGGDHKAITND
jgi:hypothetical protein